MLYGKDNQAMKLSMRCATIAALLIVFFAPLAHSTEKCNGYIYDAISAGDNRAIVVNRITHYVGVQDKRDVRFDASFGNFGSFYEDCGNDTFYCLSGPLDIVIPKSVAMKQWEYNGLSCKRLKYPQGDTFRVTCTSSRLHHTGTSFTYSPSRGVLSFGNSPVGGVTRGNGFVLRGKRGLFSSGHNP
ncbi:hypothetical protein GCM10009126_33020 [Rhodanobacter caeni]|uniref:Uncharacterized protein n=1 Tax=Rhodanobacter caeni TaxID=657654 RepID=A0ABN0UXJ8_9GAMM